MTDRSGGCTCPNNLPRNIRRYDPGSAPQYYVPKFPLSLRHRLDFRIFCEQFVYHQPFIGAHGRQLYLVLKKPCAGRKQPGIAAQFLKPQLMMPIDVYEKRRRNARVAHFYKAAGKCVERPQMFRLRTNQRLPVGARD